MDVRNHQSRSIHSAVVTAETARSAGAEAFLAVAAAIKPTMTGMTSKEDSVLIFIVLSVLIGFSCSCFQHALKHGILWNCHQWNLSVKVISQRVF